MQEVRNAVDQAGRELSPALRLQEHRHLGGAEGRGDRAGLRHRGPPEGRLAGARGEGVKRQVPLKALQPGEVEPAAKGTVRQTIKVVTGITDEKAKEISKFVRQAVPKAQTQIQGAQVRVSASPRTTSRRRSPP